MKTTQILGALGALACAAGAVASDINITIENTQSAGGLSFTPFWLGVHDGSFTNFMSGNAASNYPGIEAIAELGDTAGQSARLLGAQPNAFDTTFAEPNGAPVFSPGESASMTYDVGDATMNRFFSYASMVVPSNDLFVGNGGGGIEIFDAGGTFLGPITIEIFGSNVWDAGTEVNDITNGPAFIPGQDAPGGADENGVIRAFFTDAGDEGYLDSIIGVTTAAGDTVTNPFAAGDLIARITIVPAPGATALLAGTGLIAGLRRRR